MNSSLAEYPLLVPGAKGNGSVAVQSPYDQSQLAILTAADAAAIDQALSTAHALFRDRKAWLSAQQRVGILRRASQLMQEHAETLAAQIAAEE